MAEQLDIFVNAKDTGSKEVFAEIGREAEKAFRNRRVRIPVEPVASGGGGFFRGLTQLSEEGERLNKVPNLLMGGGAALALGALGRGLQKLPDAVDRFYENLESGMTKTEAFTTAIADAVPAVGNLAKGLRAFWDWLQTPAARARELRQREDQAEQAEERERIRAQRDASRAAIMARTRAAAESSRDQLQLLDAGELNREYVAAEIAFRREMEKIQQDEIEGQGRLTLDQLEAFQKDIAARREAAGRTLNARYEELNKQANKRVEDAELRHAEAMGRIAHQIEDARLAAREEGLERAIEAITLATDREIEQTRRATEQQIKATQDAYLQDQLQRQQAERERALADRRDAQIESARQQDARRRAEEARELQEELTREREREAEIIQRIAETEASRIGRFTPGSIGVVAGETRLLTGTAGQQQNPLLAPVVKTATASEKMHRELEKVRSGIEEMVRKLTDLQRPPVASPTR